VTDDVEALRRRGERIALGASLLGLAGFVLVCVAVACHRTSPEAAQAFGWRLDIPLMLAGVIEPLEPARVHELAMPEEAVKALFTALMLLRLGMVWTVASGLVRRQWFLVAPAVAILCLSFLDRALPTTPMLAVNGTQVLIGEASSFEQVSGAPVSRPGRTGPPTLVLKPADLSPAQRPAAHYVLAQKAYMARDARAVGRHLAGMGEDYRASGVITAGRIVAMQAYAASHGVATPAFADARLRSAGGARSLSIVAGLAGLLLVAAGIQGELIARSIRSRLRRMAARLAGAPVATVPAAASSRAAGSAAERWETLRRRQARLRLVAPYLCIAGAGLTLLGMIWAAPPVWPAAAFDLVHTPLALKAFVQAHGVAPLYAMGRPVFGVPYEVADMLLRLLRLIAVLACGWFTMSRKGKRLLVAALCVVCVHAAVRHGEVRSDHNTAPAAAYAALNPVLAAPAGQGLSPEQVGDLRYIAAQLAYLDRDAAATAAHLNAIPGPDRPQSWMCRWRLWAMDGWAAEKGQVVTGLGSYGAPLWLWRLAAGATFGLGTMLLVASALVLGLFATISRRMRRIGVLQAQAA
jgi:hypothetical protein